MSSYKLSDWFDFWKLFDDLCLSLRGNANEQMELELKDAQKYVNGLSDGWYEFFVRFEKSVKENMKRLSQEQKELSEYLLGALANILKR